MELTSEMKKNIAIFRKMGVKSEYCAGWCYNCCNKTLHQKLNGKWICTRGGCEQEKREKQIIKELDREKKRRYMSSYRLKKSTEKLLRDCKI